MKELSWWKEVVGMMFGEVRNGESLGELIVGLEGDGGKEYDVGVGGNSMVKGSVGYGNESGD